MNFMFILYFVGNKNIFIKNYKIFDLFIYKKKGKLLSVFYASGKLMINLLF